MIEVGIGLLVYFGVGWLWIVMCRLVGCMIIEPAVGVSRLRCEMMSALVWPYIVFHLARLVFAHQRARR